MSFSMSIASSNCLHAERSLSAWMHPAAIPCAGSFQRATGWAAHQAQTHARTREHAQILTRARSAEGGGRTSHVRVTAHRHVPVAGLKPCTATAAPTPTAPAYVHSH
jgi:hypothetical protein